MKDINFGAWREVLGDAVGVEPGQIGHFIVAISTITDPGAEKFFFATCCDDKRWPSHMLEHLMQALAERN